MTTKAMRCGAKVVAAMCVAAIYTEYEQLAKRECREGIKKDDGIDAL